MENPPRRVRMRHRHRLMDTALRWFHRYSWVWLVLAIIIMFTMFIVACATNEDVCKLIATTLCTAQWDPSCFHLH